MLKYLKKLMKSTKIILTVIITVVFLCFLIFLNIEKSLEYGYKIFTNNSLKVEDIELSLDKAEIKKLKIYDDNEDLMIDLPNIQLSYSLMALKIKNIRAKEPKIFIIRDENGTNIRRSFKFNKNKKTKKSLIVNKIYFKDLEINYKNSYKEKEFRSLLKNIDMRIDSDGTRVFARIFSNENPDKFKIVFNNKEENYNIVLKLRDIDIRQYEDLIQSEMPKIQAISGKIDTDVILSPKIKKGTININSELRHIYLDSLIKTDLALYLKDNNMNMLLNYEIFGKKNQLKAIYRNKKLNMISRLENISSEDLSKIIPLRKSKLDLSKVNIDRILLRGEYTEEKGVKTNLDVLFKNSKFKGMDLKKIEGEFLYGLNKKEINKLNIFFALADMDSKISLKGLINDKNEIEAKFNLVNLDKTSNLTPEINGDLKLKKENEILKADIKTENLYYNVIHNRKKNIYTVKGEKFYFDYDVAGKKIGGKGEIKFPIYNLKNEIKYEIEDNIVNFSEIKTESEKYSNRNAVTTGFYNFNNKDFKFNYKGNDLIIERIYKGKLIKLKVDGQREITRYRDIFLGVGDITGLNLSFLKDMSSIEGKYNLKFNKEKSQLELEYVGKIKELIFKDFKLKNVDLKLNFGREFLDVERVGNNFFEIKGRIYNKTKQSELKLKINKMTNKDIEFDKLNFNVNDVEGKITGYIKNPNMLLNAKDMKVYFSGKPKKINGLINIKNKRVVGKNINLGGNTLSLDYDMKNRIYNIKGDIEDNLVEYTDKKGLDYPITGKFELTGEGDDIKSILRIKGSGKTLKNKLPNIILEGEYFPDEYGDGNIYLKELGLENDLGENFLNINGKINVKKKTLDLSMNDEIDLKDLKEYSEKIEGLGKINISGYIRGKFKNPDYNLDIHSNSLVVKNQKINNINFKLNGDKRSLNIDDLSFEYLKNKVIGEGNYDFETGEKFFKLRPLNKINFSLLNESSERNIQNFGGYGFFEVLADKDGVDGYFKLNEVTFKDKKYNIDISNFNANIILKNDIFTIEKFSGKVNDGDLKMDGYFKIPKKITSLTKDGDYFLNLDIKNSNYKKNEVLDLNIDSQISMTKNKILGNIVLNRGVIYSIPTKYSTLKTTLTKKSTFKEKKKKIENVLKQLNYIDLKLYSKEDLKIDIEDFNIIMGETKGKLKVDLEMRGDEGKYNLFGNTEIKNGYVYVNTNKFILDKALFSFNDKNTYLTDVNPDIFLNTRVNMDEEEINFNVTGRPKKLIYTLFSENGSRRGNFNSLLKNEEKEFNLDMYNEDIYVKFMKNILAGQLIDTISKPITKKIKETFGLSRLQIKPEVYLNDFYSHYPRPNETTKEVETYGSVLRIEAEKDLYKDKVYLYANAKLVDAYKNSRIQNSLEKNSLKDYDIGLEYRTTDNKTFGMGVGTVPDRHIYKERERGKTNYHVDFKIRKKYNSFSEIFSF